MEGEEQPGAPCKRAPKKVFKVDEDDEKKLTAVMLTIAQAKWINHVLDMYETRKNVMKRYSRIAYDESKEGIKKREEYNRYVYRHQFRLPVV